MVKIGEILQKMRLYKTMMIRFNSVKNLTNRRNLLGFILYKKAHVEISDSAKIILHDGMFEFGKSWTRTAAFNSLLFMGDNSSVEISNTFAIYSPAQVYINSGAKLILGEGYINSNAKISCFHSIKIGKNVVISEGVTIRDSDNHTIDGTVNHGDIVIEDNVWIGVNVTILKGVRIGSGAVIAAGAVVNRDVASKSLVGGVPAKVIRENVEWKR